MREVSAASVTEAVRKLFMAANYRLPGDAEALLGSAAERETAPLAKKVLCRLCENLTAARELDIPICQDTGMAVLFAEVGQEVHIDGPFEEAVHEGVRQAYRDGYMRCSIVRDPLLDRVNTGDNTPALIHTRLVPGDRIRLVAAPKGFGSENMSRLKMFTPSATKEDVTAFVAQCVKEAGGNPCPPLLIGVGIGADFEGCAELAKKALTRAVSERNPDPGYAALEREMLEAVNRTGVGPQGFGGDTTALAVNIETAPTHIAGLPVAVNINCHVMRHAECVI